MAVTSADGTRIHAEIHGEDGRPAVVLAHGWTCSIQYWAAQLADLAVDHRVIVYDLRGHGRSPVPANPGGRGGPGAFSVDALADDLEAVLAATLAPGEKAVVVGHSMGGMTVMAAARRPVFREHAAAVLLCNTGSSRLVTDMAVVPLRAGRARDRITRSILGTRLPLGPVTPLSKRLLRYGTMGPGTAPERVTACARIVQACPTVTRAGWARVLDGLDLDANVPELKVPTSVLAGAADRMTPPAMSRSLAAALPECVGLTVLTGVGHMGPVEAPEAVGEAIRELTAAHLGAKEDTA
ncbi:alpha/beta fold hydrolase [Streptomyces paludis]|uniref:alpha/beta fold hydrolase n=1 Tax=Streptomyces paludis TaxID=2282738 RepID=UPI001E4C88AC|nr:alpha/beta hydrolase [Streptomyces paludis]